jgi:FkbM family methyltransferase
MIRTLAERLSRSVAFRRRLPAEFGARPVYVSPDSQLSYLRLQWTTAFSSLLRLASQFASGVHSVWDIGSNCGVFALAAAHVASPDAEILAVEPDPFLASLLIKTVHDRVNSDRDIHVLCAAVSDNEGLSRFLVASRGRSANALEACDRRRQAGGARYVQYVPTTTLDSLLNHFKSPDLIKIDVEGAESLVLQGARDVLRNVRPVLYVEVGAQQKTTVSNALRDNGYQMFDGDGDLDKQLDCCAFNTLALPEEFRARNA